MRTDHILFVIMAVIWGVTWIAAKVGIMAVPPVFFAAARYALVGAVLVASTKGVLDVFADGRAGRVIATGLLVNVGTYGFLFWGMQHVASGVAGLVNLSMIPIGLYGLSILFGDERPSWSHAVALTLGLGGLVALFWGKAEVTGGTLEVWGGVAIVAGSFAYCFGSVLSRPLLGHASPLQLTAAHALVGAVGLALVSVLLEPISGSTFDALLAPAPLAALTFLVVFGTLVAYTIFLRLVREWGAPRAGLYAFVSPIVALIAGALVFGESLGAREALGALFMLTAAGFAMFRKGGS